jgi:hypothetical protein
MMEARKNQLISWNKCVKNAAAKYKQAEKIYRTQRLKYELTYDGIIIRSNPKKAQKDYLQAKNQMQLSISHLNWAQDGLNDFIDQSPSF